MPEVVPAPDETAVRVALWRAMHRELDTPAILDDELALAIAAPPTGWRRRGDMHPEGTKPFRAWIVARSRFIEDLVRACHDEGVSQYVDLGAGIDTLPLREEDCPAGLRVFEIDRPGPQAWKRERLEALGISVPDTLRLVPFDFEASTSWVDALKEAGFDLAQPAVVSSLGVTMYLTEEANLATLREAARLAPGSTFVTTFQLPEGLVAPEDRPGRARALRGAAASGTPFISLFTPDAIASLAIKAGFASAESIPLSTIVERYFADRSDELRPSSGEDLLIART